jgi:ABC-type multidrug transport system permease subunit
MGGAIGLGTEFMKGFPEQIICIFMIGFLPGFYISYLRNIKTKASPLSSILGALLIGILFGSIDFILLGSLTGFSQHSIEYEFLLFILASLPYLIGFELVIIFIHFFYFRKRKIKKIKK